MEDLEAIKASIFSLQAAKISLAVSPAISMVDDSIFKERLSAALMKNAEVNQPWSTIGVTQWIESGRWWLLIVSFHGKTLDARYRTEYTNNRNHKGTNGALHRLRT